MSFAFPDDRPVDKGLHVVLAHNVSRSAWQGAGRLGAGAVTAEILRGHYRQAWPAQLHELMRTHLSELGRSVADVVALDMTGFEYEVLLQWSLERDQLPVCSFMVEFWGQECRV